MELCEGREEASPRAVSSDGRWWGVLVVTGIAAWAGSRKRKKKKKKNPEKTLEGLEDIARRRRLALAAEKEKKKKP